MPDSVSFKVHGLKAIEDRLQHLAKKGAQKALTSGVRSGARVVVTDARKRVPKHTGTLRKNIYAFKLKKRDSRHSVHFGVGVRIRAKSWYQKRNKDVVRQPFYWAFIEFGTSKMPARPFLRPALQQNTSKVITTIAKKTGEQIKVEALKKR